MTDIAVIHPDLRSIGGAEAVCMNVLEALQDQYHLTLITYKGEDIRGLNQALNTDVDVEKLTIHRPRFFTALSEVFPQRFSILKNALRTRYLRRFESDFDLIISTKNELYLDSLVVHYIHNSAYQKYIDPQPETALRKLYHGLSNRIGNFKPYKLQDDVFLANSQWTADPLDEYYNTRPRVLYPPIDASAFDGQKWSQRESGFLSIGRIHPTKNILQNIEIIAELHSRGHDVHLHIIGSVDSREYYRAVVDEADRYDFIHLEGELSFDTLTDMICSHKYGIHGMPEEHFGMVIAEMVSGGMIPFVPNGGGQVEIVNKNESLIYDSPDEAVEKIDNVLLNTEVQRELRSELEKMKTAFTKDRFQQEIRDVVRDTIDNAKSDHG